MTNISGEKYLLGTEKVTKKHKCKSLSGSYIYGYLCLFFFLMDCICQQHIVTSIGVGDFVNRVPYPY